MKKLLLLFFVIILASSTFAADVDFNYIGSSCDGEGRGIFIFNIEYDEAFNSNEALVKGFPGDWYDCEEAHCSYVYYDQPPGVSPKESINTGRQYLLITKPLSLSDSRTYDLEFVYPTDVSNGEGDKYDTIDISLDCPGYDFSCSLYDFKLESCESDGTKFRMYITAEGIDQPHKIDLIEDFRYRLIGEKTQILEDRPLNEASVKYIGDSSASPREAQVISIAKDRYAIEFPYQDTAKWLTAKGRYCMTDNDRFGKRSNFEFLEMKKCTLKEFIVKTVEDKPKETPTNYVRAEEPKEPSKYFKVEPKEVPEEPAKQAAEEPEEEGPRQEINFFTFFKLLFSRFKR